jgi:branched-subunit amino acid aminotransferase/4-amino-4-deoxychorismate lyase
MTIRPADPWAFVNGRIVRASTPAVPATDPGLLIGEGVFETIAVDDGVAIFLEDHLRRLAGGLRKLGFPPFPWSLEDAVDRVLLRNRMSRGSLRITVTAGTSRPSLMVAPRERRILPPSLRVAVAPGRIDPRSPLAGCKVTSRLANELARRWAVERGCGEALLRTTEGDVAEGSISNLFVVTRGRLRTPPLSRGILAGVTRGKTIAACRRHGLDVREEPIRPADLEAADEIFLTNSGSGVVPVGSLRGRRRRFPGPRGPVAAMAKELYGSVVRRYIRSKSKP